MVKLTCSVEVKNRHGADIKRRAIKSVLALGKQPNSEDLYIMLFNSNNKNGTKYMLKENLEQVFTKFVSEGKSTLRFKEPPHDIFVQGDPIQLKCFLKTLRLALQKKVPLKELGLSSLGVTVTKKCIPQTKLVITRRSDYPIHGFPRTLEILKINDIARCSLDKGILYLQRLRTLDLSNNIINDIPPDFNLLPNLCELNLSKNEFGKCRDWRWIGNNLAKSLKTLNLSQNNMEFVPINMNNFKALITLDLSQNKLTSIPHNLASMNNLKNLNVSSNLLRYLPSSLYVLRFDWIDVSDNQFVLSDKVNQDFPKNVTLFELAASRTIQYRLPVMPGMLPVSIIQFLQKSMICVCGRATFSKRFRYLSTLYKKFIKSNTILKSGIFPSIEVILCSLKCHRAFLVKYPNHR